MRVGRLWCDKWTILSGPLSYHAIRGPLLLKKKNKGQPCALGGWHGWQAGLAGWLAGKDNRSQAWMDNRLRAWLAGRQKRSGWLAGTAPLSPKWRVG